MPHHPLAERLGIGGTEAVEAVEAVEAARVVEAAQVVEAIGKRNMASGSTSRRYRLESLQG